MIKIFNANDRDFSTAGNIIIEPIKCIEYKKKSLNGWYIEVEIPIKYKEYISKDKLCVVKTKSKLNPQAFRIGEDIEYSTRKIKFQANHVMFDSKDYVLLDVRPTNQNGLNALNYINERTDNFSPFSIYSNVENVDTAYFIRKNLLEAWTTIEERWGGVFDADNWNISFLTSVGNDNGETIAYGKNMQGFDIYEDWSSVCTKLLPVGYDGLLLPETYLESDVQYEKPYTRVVDFQTNLETEEQTEKNLLSELRRNAEAYLEENKVPKVSYTIISNVNQTLEIGDTIKVLHPFVNLFTEVLEYEYDIILGKVKSLTFGNYNRDVKTKFDNIKNSITQINQALSKQEIAINTQTNLINMLNKNGYVYIDENEILILDQLPKEKAKNVWRFGLGGIGFSSNGYEGPFETAMTMDGKINADFITTGTMSTSRIEGLSNFITDTKKQVSELEIEQGKIASKVEELTVLTNTVTGDLIKLENCANTGIIELIITGNIEVLTLADDEIGYYGTVPTADLAPLGTLAPSKPQKQSKATYVSDSTYLLDTTLIHVKPNRTYVKINLPNFTLRTLDEVKDEFHIKDGKAYIIQKIELDDAGYKYVLDEPKTIELGSIELILEEGTNFLYMEGFPSATLTATYTTKNDLTNSFATKVELSSSIKQTKKDVDISVNKKLEGYSTTEEMNASINLTANKINLEVEKKVDEEEFTGANIMLAINGDTSSAAIKADKVSLER